MSNSTAKKRFFRKEIRGFFRLKPNRKPWQLPFLAAVCVGVPLLIGLLLGMMQYAFTVSLAGLVILYLPISSNFVNRMTTLFLCSFGFIISYSIGLFFSFNPVVSSVSFGVFSMLAHWICVFFKVNPPRSFFFIMIASISSSLPFNVQKIPQNVGLIAIGTLIACFIALCYSWFVRKKTFEEETKQISGELSRKIYNAGFFESFILGIFMFLSLMIGYSFELRTPYWIPISCLAVMQGVTTYHIWKRGIHRAIGTVMGIGLCWLFLSISKNVFWICMVIIIMQFFVELFISRHYALAVIFITPLTILLTEAGNPLGISTDELIITRLFDTLIGIVLGVVGGWIIYNEQLRSKIKEFSKD